MARELKFRAWDERATHGKGKMVMMGTGLGPFTGNDLIEEEGWHVMQFAGLLDRNGKEIYEGDVVAFSYGIPPVLAKAPVIFTDGAFYALPKGHTPSVILLSELLKMDFYNPEVIGNIYENPELLSP